MTLSGIRMPGPITWEKPENKVFSEDGCVVKKAGHEQGEKPIKSNLEENNFITDQAEISSGLGITPFDK